MKWKFTGDIPIYLQIMEQMKEQIATGTWKPGEKLPSVRELAVQAGVNPNTMQKALAELEREGMLYSQRTAGRFVSENEEEMNRMQERLVQQQLEGFAEGMRKLGYEPREALAVFEAYCSRWEETAERRRNEYINGMQGSL